MIRRRTLESEGVEVAKRWEKLFDKTFENVKTISETVDGLGKSEKVHMTIEVKFNPDISEQDYNVSLEYGILFNSTVIYYKQMNCSNTYKNRQFIVEIEKVSDMMSVNAYLNNLGTPCVNGSTGVADAKMYKCFNQIKKPDSDDMKLSFNKELYEVHVILYGYK